MKARTVPAERTVVTGVTGAGMAGVQWEVVAVMGTSQSVLTRGPGTHGAFLARLDRPCEPQVA